MSEMVTTIVQLLDRCKNEAGGLTYGGFKESNDHIKFNVSDQSVRFLKAVFNAYCDLFKYGEAFIGGDVEAMKQYIQERLSRSISLSDKPTLKNFYFDILKKEEAKLETIITALSPFGNYHFPTKVEDLKELWLLDIYYNQELVELLNLHFVDEEHKVFLSIELDDIFSSEKMLQVYQLHASEEKITYLHDQLKTIKKLNDLPTPTMNQQDSYDEKILHWQEQIVGNSELKSPPLCNAPSINKRALMFAYHYKHRICPNKYPYKTGSHWWNEHRQQGRWKIAFSTTDLSNKEKYKPPTIVELNLIIEILESEEEWEAVKIAKNQLF